MSKQRQGGLMAPFVVWAPRKTLNAIGLLLCVLSSTVTAAEIQRGDTLLLRASIPGCPQGLTDHAVVSGTGYATFVDGTRVLAAGKTSEELAATLTDKSSHKRILQSLWAGRRVLETNAQVHVKVAIQVFPMDQARAARAMVKRQVLTGPAMQLSAQCQRQQIRRNDPTPPVEWHPNRRTT